MRIIQVLPTIAFGDGVSNDAIAIKKILKEWDPKTEIYAENIDVRLPAGIARHVSEVPVLAEKDIILYHFSTGDRLNRTVGNTKSRLIIRYHNITPAYYFEGYSAAGVSLSRSGARDINYLADKADLVIGDSDYNLSDMRKANYQCEMEVLPILIAFDDYKTLPDSRIIKKYRDDGWTNILFTGRIVPNKAQGDIIETFAYYKKYYNPKSRLFLVGSSGGMERYQEELEHYIQKIGVTDVHFTGHIKFDQILAYYSVADVFLCLSEHEGFCIPLVEAMYFNVPIIAYDSSAIGETLGNSGILLEGKEPLETAAVINYVVENAEIRENMIICQQERLKELSYEKISDKFRRILKKFMKDNGISENEILLNSNRKEKVCFVVQRYGMEVNGGAELQSRLFAERLQQYYDIDVLSTRAIDYMTWKDEYKNEQETINGVQVYRFSVEHERNAGEFNEINAEFLSGKLEKEREKEWLEKQGPYVPELINYLKDNKDRYKAVVFFTYLYYPTVMGISEVSEKAIVVPDAHKEPFLKMSIFNRVFQSPQAIFYNTEEERRFVWSKYHNEHILSAIGGTGVDVPDYVEPEKFREKYGLKRYIVYVGRIDEGKNCHILFQYFKEYKMRNKSDLQLVLMGKAVIPVPRDKDIVCLGFVNEEDKYNGIAGAEMLVLPSAFESLSIVVLEAMSLKVPVVVNGACDVLKGHCLKSSGALYYNNYFEFEAVVNYFLSHDYEKKIMVENAFKYVENNYQWDIIISRLKELIDMVG